MAEVDLAARVEPHLDRRRQRLAPRQFVRMVFVRTDERDGLDLRQHILIEQVAEIAPRGGCQRHADDLLQLVDRARRARAAGNDAALRPRVDRHLDALLGLVQQLAHAAAGDVVLGVGIGVDALQALQVGLDEAQAAPRCRVVAVHHQPLAERRLERRVDADDLLAQESGVELPHRRSSNPICPSITCRNTA